MWMYQLGPVWVRALHFGLVFGGDESDAATTGLIEPEQCKYAFIQFMKLKYQFAKLGRKEEYNYLRSHCLSAEKGPFMIHELLLRNPLKMTKKSKFLQTVCIGFRWQGFGGVGGGCRSGLYEKELGPPCAGHCWFCSEPTAGHI